MPRRVLPLLLALLVLAGVAPLDADAQNGNIPKSALSPINADNGCNELAGSSAAAYNTATLVAGRGLPTNGCASAYRARGVPSDWPPPVYGTQWYFRGYWCAQGACGNAATPGYSNHGAARAVDIPPGTRAIFDRSNGELGFWKPCSDAAHESWHYLHCRQFTRPDPGVHLDKPRLAIGSGGLGQHQWVKKAQLRLRAHGDNTIKVDGNYGEKTGRSVRHFEEAQKFKDADNEIEPKTWKYLRRKPTPDNPTPPKPPPNPHGRPLGLDVSQHQPSVNWQVVESAGYDFAIIKCSEGGDFIDPSATQKRYNSIKRAGMAAGCYHYLRPRSDRSGAVEANFAVSVMRNLGFSFGDIRPVVDIEETSLSDEKTCGYLRSFTRRIRELLDTKPIIYTFPSFARSVLANCGKWLTNHLSWRAHYGTDKPDNFPWPRPPEVHQFTSEGKVPGTGGGNIDLNRALSRAAYRDLFYREKTVTGGVPAPRGFPVPPPPDPVTEESVDFPESVAPIQPQPETALEIEAE